MRPIKQYTELYFHAKFLYSILTSWKPYWRKLLSKSTDMGYSTKNRGCSVSLILLTVPLKESCWHMVILGNRVMGEGTSPLLSPINLSLSQDLRRPKAIMAIYMESQCLRIVSQFLWQHSSYKSTALQAHQHPRVLSAIPLTVNFPSKHARLRKLTLTPPLAERIARCWGTLPIWMARGYTAASWPPSCLSLPSSPGPPRVCQASSGMRKPCQSAHFHLCPAAFSSSSWTEKSITQKINMEKTEITSAFTIARITQ